MTNEKFIPIDLPSQCLVYPGVDKSQIQIRALKGQDEELIAELSVENFDKKFTVLLRSVLKGIDPLKLTRGDRMHLALWETINSYSKDFNVDFECEHCWQKAEYVVDLSKLEVIKLPDNFAEPYKVQLPESGDLIILKLWRVEDLIKVAELESLNQNSWNYSYALTVVNDKSIWDNVAYIKNLPTKDTMLIRAFQTKFEHGPKFETAYECPKCGGTGIMPVPFRLEMLLPYGKKLVQSVGNKI